jgi:hypothetical protein
MSLLQAILTPAAESVLMVDIAGSAVAIPFNSGYDAAAPRLTERMIGLVSHSDLASKGTNP